MTLEQALQRLQTESEARKAAESRVRELEAQVDQLKKRAGDLQNGKPGARRAPNKQRGASPVRGDIGSARAGDDPIDAAICEYLERNPDFPVLIQKVAPNYYVFGERGTIYVTQRGDHIVVRVGGGFKSLQVFMDERALMSSGIAAL
jgi:putative component of toxin-antitoxin plasmid stabilization module